MTGTSLLSLISSLKILGLTLAVSGLMGGPAQAAEVTELSGAVHQGELQALTAEMVTVEESGQTTEIPVRSILDIQWSRSGVTESAPQTLLLTDGSRLVGDIAVCDGLQVQFHTRAWGEFQTPLQQVRALLLTPLDEKTQTQWRDLLTKTTSDDMLVVRKGDALDFLPGVVTEYNEKEVLFLYQGSEIPVKREKVFGLIHPRPIAPDKGALCRLTTTWGDELAVHRLTLENQQFQVQRGSAPAFEIPADQIQKLDYSMGRVVYLSDLNPDSVEHTPYFDTVWTHQRDRTNLGRPLRLKGQTFAKGLWIHSKTKLTYRLLGEYSRFQTVVGIDDAVADTGFGHVNLVITADDKVIFEQEISAQKEPIPLDLDMANVRFLHILVDFGNGLDIGDHLDLGDAKLIK